MRFRNDIYDKIRADNKPIVKKKIENYETSVDEVKEDDKVENTEEQNKSQEDIKEIEE